VFGGDLKPSNIAEELICPLMTAEWVK
jgi:hypothetical protein